MDMRSKLRLSAGITSALCVLSLATPAGADSPTPKVPNNAVPAQDPAMADLMRRQQPLLQAADALHNAIDEEKSGYAGIAISPEQGSVRLYWRGTPPAQVASLVRSLAVPGRTVTVKPARYTWAELSAEAARLHATDRGVVEVAIKTDGSGLEVAVDQRMAGARTLAVSSRVGTAVRWGQRLKPATRWADQPPWWGGSVLTHETTLHICSTAFAVNTPSGPGLLTAAHCGVGFWRTLNTEAAPARRVGAADAVATHEGYDLMTMRVESNDNVVYRNGSDPSGFGQGEIAANVVQAATAHTPTGTLVCNDGGFSWGRCGLRVGAVITYTFGSGLLTGIEAIHPTGLNAVGNGDSGGPALVVFPGGNVRAEGVQSALDPSRLVPCTGLNYQGRQCSSRAVYAPSHGASHIGATVRTS